MSNKTDSLRACEKCGGPGPCLYDDSKKQYLCVGCHTDPRDSFFAASRPIKPDEDMRGGAPRPPCDHVWRPRAFSMLQDCALCRDSRRRPSYGAVIHPKIAACLGWTVIETQSFSLQALRELVRAKDPASALIAEITQTIEDLAK